MAGILNKKERFVDYKLTSIGKQKISDPLSDKGAFYYLSFSDKMAIYEKENFSDVPVFEVVQDVGTISSADSSGDIGFHSWNDELLFNCVLSGTTSTNSNGFDYFETESSGKTIPCNSSSFVISSFYTKLKNVSSLLVESKKDSENSFSIVSEGLNISEPLLSNDLYSFSDVVSYEINLYNEGFSSHPDFVNNIKNFKLMPPVGIGEGTNYSTNIKSKSKEIDLSERKYISLKVDKTSRDNNLVLQMFNLFSKSDIDVEEDNIDFSRLSFIRLSDNKYSVGIIFNKKDLLANNKFDVSPMSLIDSSFFNVANSRMNFPVLDSVENISNWSGNEIAFMKLFTLDIIR